jgi:hypothetical protein
MMRWPGLILLLAVALTAEADESRSGTQEITSLGIRYVRLPDVMSDHRREIEAEVRHLFSKAESCLRAGCHGEAAIYFDAVLSRRYRDHDAHEGLERVKRAQSFLDLPNPSESEDLRVAVLRDAVGRVRTIDLGMTRKETERILGPEWHTWVTAGWASGQYANYRNRALPGYKISIVFGWVGKQGIGRHAQEIDPVIRAPELVVE